MREVGFNETGIDFLYNKLIDDSLNALMDKKELPKIKIVVDDIEMEIPNHADAIEILFAALDEIEEDTVEI